MTLIADKLPTKEDAHLVSALRRGLSILDAFSGRGADLGVNEIARMVNMHKSTVSRLCATLESAGYLQRDARTNRFRLGARLYQLTGTPTRRLDLLSIARPVLTALVTTTRETATLAVLENEDIVTIDVVDGLDFVRMQARVGMRTEVHASAVAKAILAWVPEADRARVLAAATMSRLTPNTMTSISDLIRHLGEIRHRGYAVDMEELEVGLRCVGAPIRDHSGAVTAGISISGPRHRMNDEAIKALGQIVRRSADTIAARMGAPPAQLASVPGLPNVAFEDESRDGPGRDGMGAA